MQSRNNTRIFEMLNILDHMLDASVFKFETNLNARHLRRTQLMEILERLKQDSLYLKKIMKHVRPETLS